MKPDNPYLPLPAVIKDVQGLSPKERLFTISLLNGKGLNYRPGQFVIVSILGIGEAPISIASTHLNNREFQLCIRRVGRVTTATHRLQKGDIIGIRGPYGNGFPLDRLKGKDLLFIAGGIGIAPLRSMIETVAYKRKDYGRVAVLYGSKTPEEILFEEDLMGWKDRGIDSRITIDRYYPGWGGHVGVVTTLIPALDMDPDRIVALVCGPPVMYKYVLLTLMAKGLKEENILLSLERRMRCGLGLCGHCQINSIYVCQTGPVFRFSEIRHLREAI